MPKEKVQIDAEDDDVTPTASTFNYSKDMMMGCEIVQSSSDALDSLRSLPKSAILLLLTPVMAMPDNSRPHTDPFESLGRNISKRHARVRHVPYVSRLGFTDTHLVFMRQAHAIIIVTAGSTDIAVQGMKNAGLHLSTTDSVYEIEEETMSIPTALIQFGGQDIKASKVTRQEIILKATHASEEVLTWLSACYLDQTIDCNTVSSTTFRTIICFGPTTSDCSEFQRIDLMHWISHHMLIVHISISAWSYFLSRLAEMQHERSLL
ncbi:hypothetical protein MRB53_039364 [Persea americana]|nr:hypothetical protein MRB53_039364 [Persea americana]